jgi:hypothetical protein
VAALPRRESELPGAGEARAGRYGEAGRADAVQDSGEDSGRGTAGACAARAVSRLAGNGFELLLGTCSVPVKLAFCLQFSPLQFLLPSLSFGL